MAGAKDQPAVDEFLGEAQDLIEVLSRVLLTLEAREKAGESLLEPFNDLFRTVHTLKGLSGMFGFADISRLAHILEDLLDDLRLGRLTLNAVVLDRLFEGGEGLSGLMGAAQRGEVAHLDLAAFASSVQGIARKEATPGHVLDQYNLDPTILAVLTEYEEHRLQENLARGAKVYSLHVAVPLEEIENIIEGIKGRCRGIAEIIGYLPSMERASESGIDIMVLIASELLAPLLSERLGVLESALTAILRKELAPAEPSSSVAHRSSFAPATTGLDSAKNYMPATLAHERNSQRSLSSMVRVDIRRLDDLLNTVGELGVVRSRMARLLHRVRGGELEPRQLATEMYHVHRSFGRLLNDVQSSVLNIRMVPLSQLFDKMAVVLRQTARDTGKDAHLSVTGGDTEVDKLIVEAIADPLMHIVRNAVDHGIETAEDRVRVGKPAQAEVTIYAYHKGNHVIVEVTDDGRGIDWHIVRDAAARSGLLPAASVAEVSSTEVLQVLFAPGFSTAREVTELSGRGVGMDVVKTNIARLGGAVDLASDVGIGTKVTITLPITLAIINVLLFEVGGRLLSISLASVQEALRVNEQAFFTVGGREMLTLRGETLPLCRLGSLLGYGENSGAYRYVIVIALGQKRVGLIVDRLAGQQDVVIKALGPSLSQVAGIAGATDLGDGRLILVLDSAAILEEVLPSVGQLQLSGGAYERL